MPWICSHDARSGALWRLCVHNAIITPPRYCDQPVCLCVCLSVREHISGTTGPIITKFCVQILYGRGSVLLRRCCATLCTSGFINDITFGRNGPYGVAWLAWSAPATSPQLRAKSDVYECLLFCAGGSTSELMCMDQPTSLVVAGCLCVVAASLVILVILRMYQTFSACGGYARVPAVLLASKRSSAKSSRSVDSCSTRLTNSETEQRAYCDDRDDQKSTMLPPWLGRNSRRTSDNVVETQLLINRSLIASFCETQFRSAAGTWSIDFCCISFVVYLS